MNSSPDAERSRLARELHDGLAQDLAAIGYRLDSLIGDVTITQFARENLRKLRFSISGVTDQVRNEIYNLRNNGGQSLAQLLRIQLNNLLLDSQIDLEINGECEISEDKRYEISRCLRELTINSRYHSGCTKILINLDNSSITYQDNGSFDRNSNSVTRESFGLLGVSERLAKLNTTFSQKDSTYEILF